MTQPPTYAPGTELAVSFTNARGVCSAPQLVTVQDDGSYYGQGKAEVVNVFPTDTRAHGDESEWLQPSEMQTADLRTELVDRVRLDDVVLIQMVMAFDLVRHANEFGERYLLETGSQSFAGRTQRIDSRTWAWDGLADTTHERAVQYVSDLAENAYYIAGRRFRVGYRVGWTETSATDLDKYIWS